VRLQYIHDGWECEGDGGVRRRDAVYIHRDGIGAVVSDMGEIKHGIRRRKRGIALDNAGPNWLRHG